MNVWRKITRQHAATQVRARAPLRLGLAGGGTDVSPYADMFGGRILNATIRMYAQTSLQLRDDGLVRFVAADIGVACEQSADEEMALAEPLFMHKAVHNRIVRDFLDGAPLSVTMTTASDAPPGSGLGSSSTLVVSMLEAYRELLALPLGEYDIAQLAYEIERVDAGQAGGKQDQYAATFGGINFLELSSNNVIVNPLRVRASTLHELESMLVLYFTGLSRESSKIIAQQAAAVSSNAGNLEAMHEIRQDALAMKDALLRNELELMARILGRSWEAKKRSAQGIANDEINRIYDLAIAAGAYSGKVSGAGGGGFMFFMADPLRRPELVATLKKEPGLVVTTGFSELGSQAWRV